jgi:hypothetical protein
MVVSIFLLIKTFISIIVHFRVTITNHCGGSTRFMNVTYIVCQERTSRLLFHCIVSILCVSIIFLLDRFNAVYCIKETIYD